MILSVKRLKSISRGLRVATILAAAMILPLAFGYAEKDHDTKLARKQHSEYMEKVEARIDKAVAEGKLTEEEAREKMAHLEKEKNHDWDKEKLDDVRNKKLEAIRDKMMAKVKAGDMTMEEAEKKMASFKKEVSREKPYNKTIEQHLEIVWDVLQEQVKAGTITQEQAEKLMTALKKRARPSAKGNRIDSIVQSERVINKLKKMGLNEDQLKTTLDVMPRIVYATKKSGSEFTGSERVHAHLSEKAGLTEEQIDQVIQLCDQISKTTEKKSKRVKKENSGIGEIRAEPPKQVYRHNK